ncbi:MAG: hypothetical protein WD512_05010, partial [Candidatus Paceibacterota bacterium]
GIIFEVKLIDNATDTSTTSNPDKNTGNFLSGSYPRENTDNTNKKTNTIIETSKPISTSIIAGGRYDNLVPNSTLIGFSIGITRLMQFIKMTGVATQRKFFLTTIGNVDKDVKLRIIRLCKQKLVGDCVFGFSLDDEDKKFGKLITEQLKSGTTDIFIVAEDELKNNQFMHKDLTNNTQTLIPISD